MEINMKRLNILFLLCLLVSLSGCRRYINDINYENKIIIDKIKINKSYEVSSINDYVYGIVMFMEYGRPNELNSNVIIGGHSGDSSNAYFNDLILLEIGDKVVLYYDNVKYIYIVDSIKEVFDTDISVLNNTGEKILTLLTCKNNDISKRIVVTCKMIG